MAAGLLGALGGLGSAVSASAQADTGGTSGRAVAQARLLIPSPATGSHAVTVGVDATVVSSTRPVTARVVGEVPGTALVITDAHASRPGGMGLCQSGTERFLRVLQTGQGPVRETYRVKLESCREDIELASPGLDWQAATGTLRIDWLQGPSVKAGAETRVLHIGANGGVTVQPAR